MDRYIGCWSWSQELQQKVAKETGLPLSIALAVNKLISKVATGRSKAQKGKNALMPGRKRAFIAPLSTAKLPSVGKATYKKLSFMGVRTIKVLSEIPPLLTATRVWKTWTQPMEKSPRHRQ